MSVSDKLMITVVPDKFRVQRSGCRVPGTAFNASTPKPLLSYLPVTELILAPSPSLSFSLSLSAPWSLLASCHMLQAPCCHLPD